MILKNKENEGKGRCKNLCVCREIKRHLYCTLYRYGV